MAERDESFKKAGSIPFKWEIRPGVSKHLHQPIEEDTKKNDHSCSLPKMLTPPPPCFTPPSDLRTPSSHSMSRRLRFDRPLLTKPGLLSTGCFLAPWFRRRWGKRNPKMEFVCDPDFTYELDTIPRWSMSTRKSRSPLWDSLSSSSFSSSHRSSPRPISNSEWAGFGLF